MINEGVNIGKNTYFAVNKQTNLIINGWEYPKEQYSSQELKSDMNYYFYDDLRDMEFDPKQYKILSLVGCRKQGIDPNDDSQWSNDGIQSCVTESKKKKHNAPSDPYKAMSHQDWLDDTTSGFKKPVAKTHKTSKKDIRDKASKKVDMNKIQEAVSASIKKILG